MKKIMQYILPTALLFVIGCERNTMPTSSDEMEPQKTLAKGSGDQSMQAHELRLKHFAKTLAKALEVPEVASYIKEEIGKKFDGDYDALWRTVKDQTFAGKGSLRGIIASNLKGLNGVINSMADVEQVPKLQIAMPVNFEKWDGVTPIKVAYTPLTIDDVDAEEIFAYDGSGEEYVLDAKTPPDFPVMVVGINERTDVKAPPSNARLSDGGGGGSGGGGGGSGGGGDNSGYYPFITEFKATRHPNQYEPWYMGKAEVYWIAYVTNTETGVTDLAMWGSDWSYTCWKLTWTGWHSNLEWRTWNHKIDPYDPSSPNSLSSITFYELDWPAHDAILFDPWFTWDCADFADWPLIGWTIQILCDLIQNTANFWANDDYIGSVNVNLTTSTQQFDGDGVKVKMKKSLDY